MKFIKENILYIALFGIMIFAIIATNFTIKEYELKDSFYNYFRNSFISVFNKGNSERLRDLTINKFIGEEFKIDSVLGRKINKEYTLYYNNGDGNKVFAGGLAPETLFKNIDQDGSLYFILIPTNPVQIRPYDVIRLYNDTITDVAGETIVKTQDMLRVTSERRGYLQDGIIGVGPLSIDEAEKLTQDYFQQAKIIQGPNGKYLVMVRF